MTPLRWSVLAAFLLLAACRPAPAPTPIPPDLGGYRARFPTTLLRHGPPPESWQDPTPLERPENVEEVTYPSGPLRLQAWLSRIPQDGKLHPAVVFCHGGFWFGNEDWDVLQPFLDAGFVVLAPRVRAENGNPGDFEYYYGEVDDVVAAGRFLASQKGVDPARVFVSGHSAGADLAALAAMLDNPFALSAPIGASLDMRIMARAWEPRHQQLVVFDPANVHEVTARCALLFTGSLRAPVHLFHGSSDWGEPLKNSLSLRRRPPGRRRRCWSWRATTGNRCPTPSLPSSSCFGGTLPRRRPAMSAGKPPGQRKVCAAPRAKAGSGRGKTTAGSCHEVVDGRRTR